MTMKVTEEIERLAANLGITFEQAEDLLMESQSNFTQTGFVMVECPMTGTVEFMEVNEKSK